MICTVLIPGRGDQRVPVGNVAGGRVARRRAQRHRALGVRRAGARQQRPEHRPSDRIERARVHEQRAACEPQWTLYMNWRTTSRIRVAFRTRRALGGGRVQFRQDIWRTLSAVEEAEFAEAQVVADAETHFTVLCRA